MRVGRNPAHPRFWADLERPDDSPDPVLRADEAAGLTVDGFAIFGTSGIGKTKAVERALSLFPQVIEHGAPLHLPQLVWLKIECPTDGSAKMVCYDILEAVDDLLGTPYYREHADNGRASVNRMVGKIGRVVRAHNLGVLVIDEIQVLKEMRRGTPEALLNFFLRLVNVAKVPIILVGTNKARSLVNSRLLMARRMCGQGDVVWNQMRKDATWELFVTSLWRYDYLAHPAPAAGTVGFARLADALYEETQGITDFAIKVFLQAQLRAIESREERLTVDTIRSVAVDKLRAARPLLLALKGKDERALEEIDDLSPLELDSFIDQAAAEAGAARQDTTPPARSPVAAALPSSTGPRRALRPATVTPTATPTPPSRRRATLSSRDAGDPGGLAGIIARGAADTLAPYDALHRAGYIASASEFLADEVHA